MPVIPKNKDKDAVMGQVDSMAEALAAAGVRCKVDSAADKSPGWKFNFWEMKGVPVRLEVGPRDVAKAACVLSRRDKPGKEGKQFGVPAEAEGLMAAVEEALGSVQVRRCLVLVGTWFSAAGTGVCASVCKVCVSAAGRPCRIVLCRTVLLRSGICRCGGGKRWYSCRADVAQL